MFVFKGISSIDMEVIIEEESHFLGKASQRYLQTDIEGRNGALFEEQGYTTIERPIKVQILNPEKYNKILAWLDGAGIFEYKNRITKAMFYSEVTPERSASIHIAEFNFIRNPFWTKKRDEFVQVGSIVINEGTIYSQPIIRIEKTDVDKVDLTINGVRFLYEFKNEDYVEIDCEEQTVEYEGLNRNRQIEMDYKFPKLNVGENEIIRNTGNPKIMMRRKDRWL